MADGEDLVDLLIGLNDALDGANTGGMFWEYTRGSSGYAILDADGSEKGWIVDAVSRAYPRRVAGDLTGYVFDDFTRELKVDYVLSTAVAGPTELAVPERLYPQGFHLYLSDPQAMSATHDAARGVVSIDDAGPDRAARSVWVMGYE
jgi:hypothetical protein